MGTKDDFKALRRKFLIAVALLAVVLVGAYLAAEGQW